MYNFISNRYPAEVFLMALSIRNEHAERLARDVAKESGESLTQAIIHALEERLQRLRSRRNTSNLQKEIMNISRRCCSLPDLDLRSPDDILEYNKDGGICMEGVWKRTPSCCS
jgi:antitoxin VapB